MIRFIVGLFIVFGAVGNLDYDPEASLLANTILAAVGLLIMWWPILDKTLVDDSPSFR